MEEAEDHMAAETQVSLILTLIQEVDHREEDTQETRHLKYS